MEHGFETLLDAIHSERDCMNMLQGMDPVIHGPRVGFTEDDIEQERAGYDMWQAYEASPAAREAEAYELYDQIPF